nr:TonB family protein [Roseomonas haemaphysalidis]
MPPPPVTTATTEPVAEPPPPETVTATTPPDVAPAPPAETLRAVEPEPQQAVEPDTVPLEAVDIPPPPPAPPPPPVQARAPSPPPPRPTPRREAPPVATPPVAAPPSEAPPAQTTAAPAASAPAATPRRVPAAPPAAYSQRIFGALVRAQRYPTRARLARIEGTPYVTFSFRRDGTVVGARLERSSGNADLDKEVVDLVLRASPLPRPPDDYPGEVISMTAPVNFTIR